MVVVVVVTVVIAIALITPTISLLLLLLWILLFRSGSVFLDEIGSWSIMTTLVAGFIVGMVAGALALAAFAHGMWFALRSIGLLLPRFGTSHNDETVLWSSK